MTEQTINETLQISVNDKAVAYIEEAAGIANNVRSLSIKNDQEYLNSGEFLKKIKSYSKYIDDERKSITKPLDEIKKRVMIFFKEPLDDLNSAENIFKKAILDYKAEKERKQIEAEKKAVEIAIKKEDSIKAKLDERAKKAEKNGNELMASQLREQKEAVYIPSFLKTQSDITIKGISTKKMWRYRIIDETLIPRNYMEVNEKMIYKMLQATQGLVPIPGVEFYQDEVVSAGRN